MKNITITIIIFLLAGVAKAQTGALGINTPNPNATLDVEAQTTAPGKAEGVIAPRLAGAVIKSKDADYGSAQTGAIVYVTSASPDAGFSGTKTRNITDVGYYYFDGSIWQTMKERATPSAFYMPSILLPTDNSDATLFDSYNAGTRTFSVNLYNRYYNQYNMYAVAPANSAQNPGANAALPTYAFNQLDYFITYYDPLVLTNVNVSDAGILTYTLQPDPLPISEKTFMNIILMAKP
ncbi:hypothetical protein [Fluviicola sp.]|jgi:hypothetical protein|uniref:hypothetical protein n=1 Tax=Fluviicola sp. TaxID=1917219 RepID=UPI002831974E|nr:hypothetical protein [Fluviicola sp.]MDR0802409.1 hypothetical protein [Fluviicola sp.]